MADELASQNSSAPLDDGPSQWNKPARYSAAVFLVVATAILLIALLPVADMVALGFIIAFLLYLPVRGLVRRTGRSYTLVVVLLDVLRVVVVVLGLSVVVPYFVNEVDELSVSFEDASARLEIPENELLGQLLEAVPNFLAVVTRALISVASGLAGVVGLVGSALIFSLFLMLDLGKARGTLAKWVPTRFHRDITLLLMRLDRVWVGYLLAQVIYGSLLFLVSLVQYNLMGVPFPVAMSIMTGVISLIPTIGGLLSSVIVASFCLIFGSSVFVDMSSGAFALLVVSIDVLKTQITYNFIALPIVGRYVKLPVSVVFVGVLVGLALGSIILAFLVVPILSTLRIMGSYILSKVMGGEPFPGETVPDPPEAGFFSQVLIPGSDRPG